MEERRDPRVLLFLGAGVLAIGVALSFVVGARIMTPSIAGLPAEYVRLATKWARAYGVPLQWVLTTILVESKGNPNAVGDYHVDPKGASIGLMQINSKAHAAELAAAGLTRESLFNPDTNIEWGTKILRKCVDRVTASLAGRAGDIGLLARLCYTGVQTTNPDTCPSCPTTAANWRARLAQTSAVA